MRLARYLRPWAVKAACTDSVLVLGESIELPASEGLMRRDRVDFLIGGEAMTRVHQGPAS